MTHFRGMEKSDLEQTEGRILSRLSTKGVGGGGGGGGDSDIPQAEQKNL